MHRPKPHLVLHIGLPKTGTTFLQKRLFSRQWFVPYFGVHSRIVHPLDAGLKQVFRKGVPQDWASFRKRWSHDIAATVDSLPYRWHDTMLCSNENYFTSTTDIAHAGHELDPDRVAGHLREFRRSFWKEDVRVLIGIRRQDQWLASNYAEQAFRRELSGQKDFERKMSKLTGQDGPSVPWLDYSLLISRIADAVGRENVSVLLMEELSMDPEAVLGQIESFIGHPLHGAGSVDFKRQENVKAVAENCWRLNDRAITNPRLLKKSGVREEQIVLSPELGERIMAACRPGNLALASLLGRDLSRFGY
ncbi:MAG TPA: sulfotransferase domain-containing protein [Gammaproteobacteria bacterium]